MLGGLTSGEGVEGRGEVAGGGHVGESQVIHQVIQYSTLVGERSRHANEVSVAEGETNAKGGHKAGRTHDLARAID